MPRKVFPQAALFVTSVAFVYVFSYSTSPRYDLLGGDSSLFQCVGNFWAQGHLPYVDAFEHKGPLLFLINALGYAIAPRAGLMVPQVLCLYVACVFVWRAMSLWSSSRWRVLFMLLTLIYYAAHYEEGNHVEEYSVAFLSAAAYFFLRGLKEGNFPPLVGFVHGVGFGACMMIRISDAAQICCQVVLIAAFLIRDGDFRNFRRNVLSFCAGVAVMVLPFVVYFAAHGALYDMIYGTFLFNMLYTVEATFHLPPVMRTIYSAENFFPLLLTAAVAALSLMKSPANRLMQSGLFVAAMMIYMLTNLREYLHYCMIIFAFAPLMFAVLCGNVENFRGVLNIQGFSLKRVFMKIFLVSAIGAALVHFALMSWYLQLLLRGEGNELYLIFPAYDKRTELLGAEEEKKIYALQKLIPEGERDSFVSWAGVSQSPHWCLRTGMMPRERFFMNNRHLQGIDPRIRQEWFGNVRRDPPLWILYGAGTSYDAELEQLLAEKYSLKGETFIFPQVVKLYRLKG